jgi:hypothetical protein
MRPKDGDGKWDAHTQDVALAVALHEGAPRGRRLLGIEVGARHPLELLELDGRVDEIAGG